MRREKRTPQRITKMKNYISKNTERRKKVDKIICKRHIGGDITSEDVGPFIMKYKSENALQSLKKRNAKIINILLRLNKSLKS